MKPTGTCLGKDAKGYSYWLMPDGYVHNWTPAGDHVGPVCLKTGEALPPLAGHTSPATTEEPMHKPLEKLLTKYENCGQSESRAIAENIKEVLEDVEDGEEHETALSMALEFAAIAKALVKDIRALPQKDPAHVPDTVQARVRKLDRCVIVHILEKLCSIQCYDHESDRLLQDNVIQCIRDGDIDADDIPET